MDRSAAAIVSSRLAALRSSRSRISSAWVSRQALVKANKKKKNKNRMSRSNVMIESNG